jgi:hypothetical protein
VRISVDIMTTRVVASGVVMTVAALVAKGRDVAM